MTDAQNSTTAYAYDTPGRRTSTTWPDHIATTTPGDPDYGITEVSYNDMGRVLRTTDQLGETITHLFDLASRRTTREYRTLLNSPAGPVADQDTFTFDDAGRILTALKGRYSNTVTFTYNDAGRRASEALTAGGQTYAVSLDYDDAGRTSQITYPDATTVDRTYTARGRLSDVDYAASDVAAFAYDDGGRETTRTHGNSLVTTTSYAAGENLIASLNNTTVGNYSYTYDANDNKTAETISGVMSNYGFDTGTTGYDDEDRLTNWERDDTNLDQSWNLSAVGDWTSFTENTVAVSRTHNAVHELTAIATAPLTYDAKGNLTTDDASLTYAWDADNMLSSATVPTAPTRGLEGTHTYTYDALGRRVSKTVNDTQQSTTETTVFVSLTQPIAYSPWAGQVQAEYTSGTAPSSPLRKYTYGTYIDEPLTLIDRTSAGTVAAGTDEPFTYHRNQQYSNTAIQHHRPD